MAQEETLNLKSLQAHIIKAVIGSVVTTLFAGLIMYLAFYWQTKDTLTNLTKEQSDIRVIVDKHSDILNSSVTNNTVSDVQIKNLEKRISSMEQTQNDMMKILIEINSSQKFLVKNNK